MGYLGEEIKKLGFGLMRLPQKDGAIDLEQTKQMVDLFMEAGFTYFDTAWAYAGSEDAIRQALVERYPRDAFYLATKNAAWINCKTKEDAIAQFETSLKQTGAGYFNFYLLHNLGESRTHYFDDFDLWSWVQEKKTGRFDQTCRLFFSFDTGRINRDSDGSSGNGVCPIADQLCRLGKSGYSIESVLRSSQKVQ